MPIKTDCRSSDGQLERNLGEPRINAAVESREGLLWVDVSEPGESDGLYLQRVFGFHPLTIWDSVDTDAHALSIEDYGDYLFVTVRGINYSSASAVLDTTELNAYVGPNYVVTNHNLPSTVSNR